mmetsp:Transcript_28330/g.27153  ORF Transcript_28330/g.27153 Transcript_28330/m.27153 type:complete len:84 (-) Transcript_28330:244-495(-)
MNYLQHVLQRIQNLKYQILMQRIIVLLPTVVSEETVTYINNQYLFKNHKYLSTLFPPLSTSKASSFDSNSNPFHPPNPPKPNT